MTAALNSLVAAANNLTGTLNAVLAAKGYQPLREVDFTQPGDMQISGVYRYYFSKWWRLAVRPYIHVYPLVTKITLTTSWISPPEDSSAH